MLRYGVTGLNRQGAASYSDASGDVRAPEGMASHVQLVTDFVANPSISAPPSDRHQLTQRYGKGSAIAAHATDARWW